MDAAAVRDSCSSRPSNRRPCALQALEALIAFKDPALPEAVGGVLLDGSPHFLGQDPGRARALGRPEARRRCPGSIRSMDPELQPLAIDLLLQRQAVGATAARRRPGRNAAPGALNANHLRKILESNDREAIWAVEKAFGTVRAERNPQREKVVAEMGEYLRQHPGDPQAGRRGLQEALRPVPHDLRRRRPAWAPTSPPTAGARSSNCSPASSTRAWSSGPATSRHRRDEGRPQPDRAGDRGQRPADRAQLPGGGKEADPRGNVEYATVSKLSMMPEGIENLLDRKELADLFAFLAGPAAGDPQARPIPGAPGPGLSNARCKVERATASSVSARVARQSRLDRAGDLS